MGREAKKGREIISIQPLRHDGRPQDQPLVDLAGKREQHRTHRRAGQRRHSLQQRPCRRRHSGSPAQERQDPPAHRICRCGQGRHCHDQKPRRKHLGRVAQRAAAQVQAKAGEQDEAPADGLLPDKALPAVVPGKLPAAQIHRVP